MVVDVMLEIPQGQTDLIENFQQLVLSAVSSYAKCSKRKKGEGGVDHGWDHLIRGNLLRSPDEARLEHKHEGKEGESCVTIRGEHSRLGEVHVERP